MCIYKANLSHCLTELTAPHATYEVKKKTVIHSTTFLGCAYSRLFKGEKNALKTDCIILMCEQEHNIDRNLKKILNMF